MPFSSIADLTSFVNSNINTNGTDSITGANLNTGLNGVIQYLGSNGAFTVGTYSATITIVAPGATLQSITIPLSVTPTIAFAQITNNPAVDNVISLNANATTDGILVYYESLASGTRTININYFYI